MVLAYYSKYISPRQSYRYVNWHLCQYSSLAFEAQRTGQIAQQYRVNEVGIEPRCL